MSADEIRGRNLIKDGRFPSSWKTYWKHIGEVKGTGIHNDDEYGQYLLINENAAVAQIFETATFTTVQMESADYRLSFQYENYGGDANAKVVVITSSGVKDPINLSGRTLVQPLATWNPFTPYPLNTVVAEDKSLTFELHGSDGRETRGLCITDIDVQLHLKPLTLSGLQVDDRAYEV